MRKPRTTGKYTKKADEAMDDYLQQKAKLSKKEHDEFDKKDHAHVRKRGVPKTLDEDREIDKEIIEGIVSKRRKKKKKKHKKK